MLPKSISSCDPDRRSLWCHILRFDIHRNQPRSPDHFCCYRTRPTVVGVESTDLTQKKGCFRRFGKWVIQVTFSTGIGFSCSNDIDSPIHRLTGITRTRVTGGTFVTHTVSVLVGDFTQRMIASSHDSQRHTQGGDHYGQPQFYTDNSDLLDDGVGLFHVPPNSAWILRQRRLLRVAI